MITSADTIAAIATAPGRGGVAVIRISGDDAFTVVSKVVDRQVTSSMAGRFFRVFPKSFDGVVLDDGLMLVFASPRSYTGENAVELQIHGGGVSPRRVLEAVLAAGARLAERGEFTKRAFLNGKLDLTEAEAVIDLVDAKNERAADDAVARLGGKLGAALSSIYEEVLSVSTDLEHELDFSEDELPDDVSERVLIRLKEIIKTIEILLATALEGRLLREGALVVLAGAPNTGKSSLMNALLGENRAIVSDTAGTTRDSIEEYVDVGGWPVRLTDTAGLRDGTDAIEAEGVKRAIELVKKADIVLALDNGDYPNAIRVHSKCDLGRGEGINVSSKTGEGLNELKLAIAERLRSLCETPYNEETCGVDITERQRAILAEVAIMLKRAIAIEDIVLRADFARASAEMLARSLGRVWSEDMLDNLFSRFCIGK